ncbi:MAG: DEAD/DEAH box helicase [Actinomycetes bacterium]
MSRQFRTSTSSTRNYAAGGLTAGRSSRGGSSNFSTSQRGGQGRRPTRSSGSGRSSGSDAPNPAATIFKATPFVEAETFGELDLPAAIVERLAYEGIIKPFPIQSATVADAVAGRDVLGRAETGSGKTLAFGLPMLARLARRPVTPYRPLGLVLVPTRELAMQVVDALTPIARGVGVELLLVAGGLPIGKQMNHLQRGVHIVVATPGRLTDLVDRGAARLDKVEIVVLDEADRMADMGFLPVVTAFLEDCPRDGQRLLFSATLDKDVNVLVRRHMHDPVVRSISPTTASVATMSHHVLVVSADDKADVTAHVANREGRSILFVRTKHGADRMAKALRTRGVLAASLHGDKTQSARTKVLDQFRDGTVPVLVATDVAARGIHVDDVGLVLHVDPPASSKDYLHRSGRTARAGGSGTVVMLALPQQRREVDDIIRDAGVRAEQTVISAKTDVLSGITGARVPSGIPVNEPSGPRESSRRPGRGRSPGGRNPRTPVGGAGRGRRTSGSGYRSA